MRMFMPIPTHLLINSIVVRLRQGGQIEGVVDLSPGLLPIPGAAGLQAQGPIGEHSTALRGAATAPSRPGTVPINGKVTAEFKDVALDTILDMVSAPPFQRLGIGAIINGPSTATWTNGDMQTVSVNVALNLNPPAHPSPGEAPTGGVIDGTYTQRNGAVDLRKLELNLPDSQLLAHGDMGAYPLTSPSVLSIDFHSRNLGEFDTVLRSLGLKRNGKTGTAALPVALSGQADFHGTWAGSLANPHFSGNLKATRTGPRDAFCHASPRRSTRSAADSFIWIRSKPFGSYSATRIAIDHGLLLRGNTEDRTEWCARSSASGDPSPSPRPSL